MSSARPITGSRQRTGQQNGAPGGGMPISRPLGTASRLATAMRPSSRGGGLAGGSLNQQLRVEDRPMTQQGLGGLKTGLGKGPRRQVEDKSYYIGLLRSKMNELQAEISTLTKRLQSCQEDGATFVQYEQMAEKLAQEIKDLQGELGDYNTLVDKLNTDQDVGNMQMDFEDMKVVNERADGSLVNLFETKKSKEDQLKKLEIELDQERSMADTMVQNMDPKMRQVYMQTKDLNDHLLKQLEKGQQDLDSLNIKKAGLEDELSMSQVKQEAMRLYAQIHELETKRDQLLEERQATGDPQTERENLLKTVKEDNQEIASMERQVAELKDKMVEMEEDARMAERDLDDNNGERNQKYRELKKREEQMDEFLQSYESNKAAELERMSSLEGNVVALLERMSRNMARTQGHMPSPAVLATMKDQLQFKSSEVKKSESTQGALSTEHSKLQQDLLKVDQLETKISKEMETLTSKIKMMESELPIYADLEQLKENGETKKQKLLEDKSILDRRRQHLKRLTHQMSSKYDEARKQLADNETHAQLCNLERKWQQHEQNNFVMKEFIATKMVESDFGTISRRVNTLVEIFNTQVRDELSHKASL